MFSTEVKLGPVKLREKHKLRVFKNSVLRITFWFIMDAATGDWHEVHNEELQNLHSSPYIIRVLKPRTRWVWHVASMGGDTFRDSVGGGNLKERHHLEDLSIDGRLILKCMLQKQGGMA